MFVDKLLQFSDGQAVTAAAASDSVVDQGVANRLSHGGDLYLVVVVATALTDGGSNTGTNITLQGDSTESFSPDGTVTLGSFAQAAAAGTTKVFKLAPSLAPLAYRYLRVYYDPQGANLTGGAFSAFLTKDAQAYLAHAKNYTIT